MYVLLLLPLVLATGYLVWRFAYRREIDPRPGLAGLGALALGALLSESLLPGGWRWFGFAGATAGQLASVWWWACLVAAALAAFYVRSSRPVRPYQLVFGLTLACAALCAVQTLVVVNLRIDYPFDLEWIEGGLLDHAVRIQSGEPLYQAPDVDFVPSLYAPLYMRAAALFPYVAESPYWSGRMLSLASILATAVLVYHIAAAAAGSGWTGLLMALVLLAGAPFVGDWFDLYRVDSLFLFLALVGFFLLDRAHHLRRGLVAAGAVLAAAVFAKQAGAFVVLAAVGWLLVGSGPTMRARVRSCAWFVLGGSAATALLAVVEIVDSGSGGLDYFVDQLGNYPLIWKMLVATVGADLFGRAGVVLLFLALLGAAALAARDRRLLVRSPMVACGAALLLIAVLQRSKWGGAENCLMPMLVGCLVLAAHGLGPPAQDRGQATAAVHVLMLVGFLWHMDLPGHRLADRAPTDADLRANQQLVEYVRSSPGPVLDPTRSHVVYQARGETSFHEMFATDWAVKHPYPEAIRRALERGEPATLILRSDRLIDAPPAVTAAIRRGYTCRPNIFRWPKGTADAITGWRLPLPTFCERKAP